MSLQNYERHQKKYFAWLLFKDLLTCTVPPFSHRSHDKDAAVSGLQSQGQVPAAAGVMQRDTAPQQGLA